MDIIPHNHVTRDLRRRLGLNLLNWQEADSLLAAVPAASVDATRVGQLFARLQQHAEPDWVLGFVAGVAEQVSPREMFARGTVSAQVTAVLLIMNSRGLLDA